MIIIFICICKEVKLNFRHASIQLTRIKTMTTSEKHTFSHLKSRLVAAIFMVLIASTVTIPGMATYLPFHQNDAVGLPILLFPFIWTGLFIYCFMAESIKRVWIFLTLITLVHIVCSYLALTA